MDQSQEGWGPHRGPWGHCMAPWGIDQASINSRMANVYNLSDMNEIVNKMIAHMKQQIEYPALSDSKFAFDEVLHMAVDFH